MIRTVSLPAKGATMKASMVMGRNRIPAARGPKPRSSWMKRVRYKNMAKMEAAMVKAASETPTMAGRLNRVRSNIGSA